MAQPKEVWRKVGFWFCVAMLFVWATNWLSNPVPWALVYAVPFAWGAWKLHNLVVLPKEVGSYVAAYVAPRAVQREQEIVVATNGLVGPKPQTRPRPAPPAAARVPLVEAKVAAPKRPGAPKVVLDLRQTDKLLDCCVNCGNQTVCYQSMRELMDNWDFKCDEYQRSATGGTVVDLGRFDGKGDK